MYSGGDISPTRISIARLFHGQIVDTAKSRVRVQIVICIILYGEQVQYDLPFNPPHNTMTRAKVYQTDRVRQKEGREEQIKEACHHVRKHKNVTLQAAATKFEVPYNTFRQRYLNLNCPASDAPRKNRVLTKIQKTVLVAWLRLWAAQGTPVSREGLRIKVERLTGKSPKWR